MEPVAVILVFIVNLLFDIFMANRMSGVADDKGYDPKEYHIWRLCFWLPVYGYMYVISLPDRRIQEQNAEIIKLMKSSGMQSSDSTSNNVEQKPKDKGYDLSEISKSMSGTWICENCGKRNSNNQKKCGNCGVYKS